jgi:hypothetical protein
MPSHHPRDDRETDAVAFVFVGRMESLEDLEQLVRETHVEPDAVIRYRVNILIFLSRAAHLDQLLAIWEFRSGPTPWLVMEPR